MPKIQNLNKVLLFGTFDLLHPGHASLFKQARYVVNMILRTKRSNPVLPLPLAQIIAVIARDITVKKIKKKSVFNERQRQENLLKTGWVDKVVLGSRGDHYQIIKKIKPDIICLGYDQKSFTTDLKKKIRAFGLNTKIVRLKSYQPKKYKSSKILNLKSKI